ncbi:hypothetical protein ACMFMF_008216 [Clarireedia jacksonii]
MNPSIIMGKSGGCMVESILPEMVVMFCDVLLQEARGKRQEARRRGTCRKRELFAHIKIAHIKIHRILRTMRLIDGKPDQRRLKVDLAPLWFGLLEAECEPAAPAL